MDSSGHRERPSNDDEINRRLRILETEDDFITALGAEMGLDEKTITLVRLTVLYGNICLSEGREPYLPQPHKGRSLIGDVIRHLDANVIPEVCRVYGQPLQGQLSFLLAIDPLTHEDDWLGYSDLLLATFERRRRLLRGEVA